MDDKALNSLHANLTAIKVKLHALKSALDTEQLENYNKAYQASIRKLEEPMMDTLGSSMESDPQQHKANLELLSTVRSLQ